MPEVILEVLKDIARIPINIILYIPRRIYIHFKYVQKLEREKTNLNIELSDKKVILERIISTCESNYYDNEMAKIRKIKELAKTVPQR